MVKKKVYDEFENEVIFDYRCMKIRCKDNKIIPYLYKKMKSTKHFENILLILIDQDYKQNNGSNFSLLTNGEVMRALLRDNEGGSNKEKVLSLREFYKGNELMESLIEVSKDLKVHNLVEQIKDIRKNYNAFFTKIKSGDVKARPPKPKKLSKLNNVTIFTDGYKSWSPKSPKKKNVGLKIRINLHNKMKYVHLPHKYLIKVVGDMQNISNININYSNGYFYFLVNYAIPKTKTIEKIKSKWAGIDPGVDNLMSVYIDDKESKSLIIDNANFIDYNVKFNRLIGKISAEIDFNKNISIEQKKGLDVDREIKELIKYRKFLYEKRNNFFYSEFQKLSVRILEYLKLKGVTDIAIPEDLAELKNNGKCDLQKNTQQKFIQIPFMQLISFIKIKASRYGICTKKVNEAFTSKTSSISQDVIKVLCTFKDYENLWNLIKKDAALSANVFKGKRAKRRSEEKKGHRGDFWDSITNKIINSDLNGAKNICSIGKNEKCFNYGLFKLCNPIKLKSDGELLSLLREIALE